MLSFCCRCNVLQRTPWR